MSCEAGPYVMSCEAGPYVMRCEAWWYSSGACCCSAVTLKYKPLRHAASAGSLYGRVKLREAGAGPPAGTGATPACACVCVWGEVEVRTHCIPKEDTHESCRVHNHAEDSCRVVRMTNAVWHI